MNLNLNLIPKNLFTNSVRFATWRRKRQGPRFSAQQKKMYELMHKYPEPDPVFVAPVEEKVGPLTNNDIKPIITNRNPRNLEKMRLATKPDGWWYEKGTVKYWHRLKIKESKDGITAELVHNSKKVAVQASTSEWAINKFLYSSKDKAAYGILAKVFAERCLESGISYCYSDLVPKEDTNLAYFVDTLQKEGLILEEPTTYNFYNDYFERPEKRPWTVLED